MPHETVAESLLLPELRLIDARNARGRGVVDLYAEKTSSMEVCPRCASPSRSVYDRRWARVKDSPVRARRIWLHIRKRRFSCRPCGKPFTEPVPGIRKGCRTTERFRREVLWACEKFADLKAVRDTYRCSGGFVYTNLYRELEKKRRTREYPWPRTIGLDEHFFRRNRHNQRCFVTMVVDLKNKKVREVVEGKRRADLLYALGHIPGRENVKTVVCDLADPYKSFAQRFFPNAQIVADKFHVLRLLHPAINRHRKAITGDKRNLPGRKLLLANGKKLSREVRWALARWLERHSTLRELYDAKEALHRLYRTRGYRRAGRALTKLCDALSASAVPELITLRKTLIKWRDPILNYFRFRITNGRTEGFNNKAKLVKRRAYGYRSFDNYRLRLLNACS